MKLTKRAFARASSGLLLASTSLIVLNTLPALAMNASVSVSVDSEKNNISSLFNVSAYEPLVASSKDVSSLIYPGMKAPKYVGLIGEIKDPSKLGITDGYSEASMYYGASAGISNMAIYSELQHDGITFDEYGNLNAISPNVDVGTSFTSPISLVPPSALAGL